MRRAGVLLPRPYFFEPVYLHQLQCWNCLRGSLIRRIDPATCHHDDPRRTCKGGALSNRKSTAKISRSEYIQTLCTDGVSTVSGALEAGVGGLAPALKSKKGQDVPIWERERILPPRAPFATIGWDFIHRAMPLGNEGSPKPDEAYSLTAYLLFLNKVIPEDEVLDQQSLPKVKMPIGDDYARLPDWKPGTPRLPGYPY